MLCFGRADELPMIFEPVNLSQARRAVCPAFVLCLIAAATDCPSLHCVCCCVVMLLRSSRHYSIALQFFTLDCRGLLYLPRTATTLPCPFYLCFVLFDDGNAASK